MLKHPEIFGDLEAIKKTKVPIIKFTEMEYGIKFDLSFNQEDGLRNNIEIQKGLDFYPELKYIMMTMKMFLFQRGFNSTYTGGISSFLLFNLVLTYLRDHYKRRYDR